MNTRLNLGGVNESLRNLQTVFPVGWNSVYLLRNSHCFKFFSGFDDVYLIPEHTIVFGDEENPSAYSHTHMVYFSMGTYQIWNVTLQT